MVALNEAEAWMRQAISDFDAGGRFASGEAACHSIAKYQQTVEKTLKSVVCALYEARMITSGIRPSHDVSQYVKTLVRLPRRAEYRSIQSVLKGLLNQDTRAGITSLDGLAPRMPTRRNTEYPFRDDQGRWTFPAAPGVFQETEVERYRALAYRILDHGGRIISAVRRGGS